jgi:predicted amidohydrolase
MTTSETGRGIDIEALSCRSPKTNEELIRILDGNFRLIREKSLIVLPEYFLRGEDTFDGKLLRDPMITTLINFAQTKNAHIVSGMIEQTESGEKYVTGLFISPKGLIEKQRKQTPTSFERSSGITAGEPETKVFNLDGVSSTLSIAMCIESFKLDKLLRSLPSEILVNPRGFDLDNPAFGSLSESWLSHNQDLARMGKRFVVGATGYEGKSGSLAEIIDFEGNVMDYTLTPDNIVYASADLDLLRQYREGKYQSKIIPRF